MGSFGQNYEWRLGELDQPSVTLGRHPWGCHAQCWHAGSGRQVPPRPAPRNSESATSSNNPQWQTERLPDQASIVGVARVLLPCLNTALPYGSSAHAVREGRPEGRLSESSMPRELWEVLRLPASLLLRGQQPTGGSGDPQGRMLSVVHAALPKGVLSLVLWEKHRSDLQGPPIRARKRACPGRLRKFTGPGSGGGGLSWCAFSCLLPGGRTGDWGLQGRGHVERVSETSSPVMGHRDKRSLWTRFPNLHSEMARGTRGRRGHRLSVLALQQYHVTEALQDAPWAGRGTSCCLQASPSVATLPSRVASQDIKQNHPGAPTAPGHR